MDDFVIEFDWKIHRNSLNDSCLQDPFAFVFNDFKCHKSEQKLHDKKITNCWQDT